MFGFSTHAFDESRIKYTTYAGRPCYSATVLQTDATGQWGDSEEHPLRRTQRKCKESYINGSNVDESFATCIPVDWDLHGRAGLWDMHYTANKPSIAGVIIKDDEYLVSIHDTIVKRIPVIPDAWIDWRIVMHLSPNPDGVIDIYADGELVAAHSGQTLDTIDDSVYFKIGPYVYDAMTHKYRRMYFQL